MVVLVRKALQRACPTARQESSLASRLEQQPERRLELQLERRLELQLEWRLGQHLERRPEREWLARQPEREVQLVAAAQQERSWERWQWERGPWWLRLLPGTRKNWLFPTEGA